MWIFLSKIFLVKFQGIIPSYRRAFLKCDIEPVEIQRVKNGLTSSANMGDSTQASLLLRKQLAELSKNPVEGFSAGLIDENDIFKWEVLIIGPSDTLYEGGFFKCHLIFPKEYPLRPPKLKVITDIWHPNIEKNGDVCISILHEPGDDRYGYEKASERWLPVHTVETILVSVISMLADPNDE